MTIASELSLYQNIADFPKNLAALKLWFQNLKCEYLTHFLMELPEFFFCLKHWMKGYKLQNKNPQQMHG